MIVISTVISNVASIEDIGSVRIVGSARTTQMQMQHQSTRMQAAIPEQARWISIFSHQRKKSCLVLAESAAYVKITLDCICCKKKTCSFPLHVLYYYVSQTISTRHCSSLIVLHIFVLLLLLLLL